MFRKIINMSTSHEGEIIDMTPKVAAAVRESRVQEGLVHLFVQHSTAALTTIEYEPGVLADLAGRCPFSHPIMKTTPTTQSGVMATDVRMSRLRLWVLLLPSRLQAGHLAVGHGSRSSFSNWM